MLNRKRGTIPSPCGANCLYTLRFQGPYLQCSSTTENMTISLPGTVITIYNSTWTNLPFYQLSSARQSASQTSASFDFTVLQANTVSYVHGGSKLNATQYVISCAPSRANYEVINTYNNNVQSLQLKIGNVQPLINLGHQLCWPAVSPLTNESNTPLCSTGNTTDQIAYIRDSNLMAVMQAMAVPLVGRYEAVVRSIGDAEVANGWRWYNATFAFACE